MQLKNASITFCLLLVSFIGFAQTNTNMKWTTYSTKGYQVEYPSSWELDTVNTRGAEFIILSPLVSEEDPFNEYVSFAQQDLTGKQITLDKYIEISESQVKAYLKSGEIVKSERVKNKTETHHIIICKGTQQNTSITFVQYYWLLNETAYILSFTSKTESYENYQKTAEHILDSFQFKYP
tara:strand:+ start:839 stop:1378 length:540 start_codon:yes stop_codon:yes gene_type:complete